MELPKRQRQVLDFIERFLAGHGYPPTLREIGAALEIRSTNAVNDHLLALERKGLISRDRSRSRGIILQGKQPPPEADEPLPEVPLLGRIAAGLPLLAEENVERMLRVDRMFARRKEKLFALRVVGQSMIEDGILDGDILLVKAQNVAEQGAIVVARVDSEATVKRYYREEGRVRLQPANRNMEPIILSEEEGRDPSIQGVVIALFRNLTSPP
jgi:repressor LexA